MPIWNVDCGADECQSQCNTYIAELSGIGNIVWPAITEPADDMLHKLQTGANTVTKQLVKGGNTLLQQLGKFAEQIDLPDEPLPVHPEAPPPPTQAQVNVLSDAITGGVVQRPHDFDQANLLILADSSQKWHKKLRQWYLGQLDGVLMASSIADAVADRIRTEQQIRARSEADFHIYSGTLR